MIENSYVKFKSNNASAIWNLVNITSKIRLNKQKGKKEILKKALKTYWIYCQRCKIYKAIIVHHINKNKKDNKLKNLSLLCRRCHMKVHNPKKKEITQRRKEVLLRRLNIIINR